MEKLIQKINQLDTQLFLFLNGKHTSWLDNIMFWASDREFWYPMYALIIGWMFWKFGSRQAFRLVLIMILSVVLSDQFTSSFLKPTTARLRPCHEPTLKSVVHIVWDCGGSYGFASSHAANSFAFAILMWLFFSGRFPAIKFLLPWAMLVSYSRIYTGAHYPLDILAGAGIGTAISWAIFRGTRRFFR